MNPTILYKPIGTMRRVMRCFTYGTLQISEVMEAVAGRVLSWVEAEAQGFAQFRFTDRIYPEMIAPDGRPRDVSTAH